MSQATAEAHTTLPIVAVAIGDPADIGPEISLKAALDSHVRALCRLVLVGDPELIVRHASACGINASIRVVDRVSAVEADSNVPVLPVFTPEARDVEFGESSAAAGRASLAAQARAIDAAVTGEVAAAVAAPLNYPSIKLAAPDFEYMSFIAGAIRTNEDDI